MSVDDDEWEYDEDLNSDGEHDEEGETEEEEPEETDQGWEDVQEFRRLLRERRDEPPECRFRSLSPEGETTESGSFAMLNVRGVVEAIDRSYFEFVGTALGISPGIRISGQFVTERATDILVQVEFWGVPRSEGFSACRGFTATSRADIRDSGRFFALGGFTLSDLRIDDAGRFSSASASVAPPSPARDYGGFFVLLDFTPLYLDMSILFDVTITMPHPS